MKETNFQVRTLAEQTKSIEINGSSKYLVKLKTILNQYGETNDVKGDLINIFIYSDHLESTINC